MRPAYAVSFAAALICHALLLFGFKFEIPARPLAISDEPSAVDVSLVASAPENPPVESTPPPAPVPTPEPVPIPTPEMSTPPPAPAQTPVAEVAPVPEPSRETPAPHPGRQKPPGKISRAAPRAAAQSAAHEGAISTGVRYRSNPKPDYPDEARRRHQEGVVLLSVEVSAQGDPVSVSLKRSSGHDLLDQAAIRAVKGWTFEPARAGAFPVASRVDVPVRFVLSE